MKKKIQVSVVIPAYNEEQYLSSCLQSLVLQETLYTFEVVIVNNNSTDNTKQIAQKYKKYLTMRIIEEKRKGRGAARAAGFSAARGDIIFSTDADAIGPFDWIEKTATYIFNHSVIATVGLAKITDRDIIVNSSFTIIAFLWMYGYKVLFRHWLLGGFNFAVLKSAYCKAGGFNKNLNANEEPDLGLRLYQLGKISFINPMVIFSGRRFKHSFIKGLFQYAEIVFAYYILREKDIQLSDIR